MTSSFLNKTAAFDQSTASTFTAVAAVTGKRIRVTGFGLTAAGTNTVTFKRASTALTGAMPVIAGSNLNSPAGNDLVFETGVGEALNITLSAAVQVAGWISYQIVE